MDDDLFWMEYAIKEAKKALSENEIPVGAVLVRDGKVVSKNHNRTRQHSNPLAHAEKLVIDEVLGYEAKYLHEYTLYVTLEPCTMCAGSLVLARIGRVVFGCFDPKSGATGSLYNILADRRLNHNPQFVGGLLASECSELLTDFFRKKRVSE